MHTRQFPTFILIHRYSLLRGKTFFTVLFPLVFLRPGISHISFAFLCSVLSWPLSSSRTCPECVASFFRFTALRPAGVRCEPFYPRISGCLLSSRAVATPSSSAHACVLVSGTDVTFVSCISYAVNSNISVIHTRFSFSFFSLRFLSTYMIIWSRLLPQTYLIKLLHLLIPK